MEKRINKRGFTLIEMIVAVGIFSVVIVITLGAILHLSKASDRSHAILTAINNLDFAMENMSRTVRTGTLYVCDDSHERDVSNGKDCFLGDVGISVTDANDRRIVFYIDDSGQLVKEDMTGGTKFPITAPEVEITDILFRVIGSDTRDIFQPRTIIRVKGRTRLEEIKEADQAVFDLQTSVSQRNPDF